MDPDTAQVRRRTNAIIGTAIGEPPEDIELDFEYVTTAGLCGPVWAPQVIVRVRGVRLTGEAEQRALDAITAEMERMSAPAGRH
jgi:hypothetical protein